MNEHSLQSLAACLSSTLAPQPEVRRKAEEQLATLRTQPGFVFLLLRLVSTETLSLDVRKSGAIFFKNLVVQNWIPSESEAEVFREPERTQIKDGLVELMLRSPLPIQKQLGAALTHIAKSDFPAQWPSLLPSLMERLASRDLTVIINVLRTLNALFKSYRDKFDEEPVIRDLKYILDMFALPFLQFAKYVDEQIDAHRQKERELVTLFVMLKLLVNIYYSLTVVDLPQHFEDNFNFWMPLWHKYLTYRSAFAGLMEGSREDAPGLLPKVQACILRICAVYATRFEEEFSPYIKNFVQAAWEILTQVGPEPANDLLVTEGIRFLSSVASSVHHPLFHDPQTLEHICEKIVLPNLRFRESDMELFQEQGLEYVRADIEGNDAETRRRAACDLVRSLRRYYEQPVTLLFSKHINNLLQSYAQNPTTQWHLKDTVIYLVTALTVTGATSDKGATQTNQLVPLLDFYTHQILPELKRPIQDSDQTPPVLVADAFKFAMTFRQQLPLEAYHELMSLSLRWLSHPNFVVHSYAAMCIDLLLCVRHSDNSWRYPTPTVITNLSALYAALFTPLGLKHSSENHYVMRAIMRVTGRAADVLAEQSTSMPQMFWTVFDQLLNKLSLVFKNPTNPLYIHFLHESLALLINAAAGRDPQQLLKQVEAKFFPIFHVAVKEDIVDMQPYEFQLMAMLLERLPQGIGLRDEFNELLQGIVSPSMWERKGNIPGMARLLVQYLRHAPQLVLANNAYFLKAILGVFQKLVASKVHDAHGFVLLEGIITYLESSVFQSYLVDIFKLLFTRLQRSKTPKFIEHFLIWLSRFVLKHGPKFVLEHLNFVQSNIFAPLLTEVCLPYVNHISEKYNRHLCALGMTKILTEWTPMLEQPYLQVWPLLLQAVVTLLEEEEPDKTMQGQDLAQPYLDFEEGTNFASTYSKLIYATKLNDDPFKNVEPRQVLVQSLCQLLTQDRGKVAQDLLQKLEPPYRQHLQRYFTSVGVKGIVLT
jgi:exportin-2 (importin alpha re-exporter)